MAELSDFIEQAEIDAYLESDQEVVDARLAKAREAANHAKSIAPVDEGDYRDGIQVRRRGNDVSVDFEDFKSHIIEYGSEHTPEFAVRARTEAHLDEGR